MATHPEGELGVGQPEAGEGASEQAGQPGDVDPRLRDADIVFLIRAAELRDAFDLIMQRYESKVYRLCLAMLRERTQAQDAAQESLVRLWRALPRYDGRAALSTWIYAITRNWCLTCLSSRQRTVSLQETPVRAEVDAMAAPDSQDALEQGHAIRQMVQELPPTTRRIVTLFYFEEQSVALVAEALGLPQGTIKTHLFRARATLLARLQCYQELKS
jgi:RNA polymerase sigma-70 factor (ECF subfamily)